MRFDINQTLLRHIGTGGGAAYVLREQVTGNDNEFIDHIGNLFSARSDIRRIFKAQAVARPILMTHDFNDIMVLREKVAEQELRRLITYTKQRDHTAHTVYLYLLGIWFFDHASAVKNAIIKRVGGTEKEACEWFLFQWMFASLLHDIGYAFFDLGIETKADRTQIDKLYQWSWLDELFGPEKTPARKLQDFSALRAVYNTWHRLYSDKLQPRLADATKPKEVLDTLAKVPWLTDLGWTQTNIFDVLKLNGQSLHSYAMEVAADGYRGKSGEGCVDHAVASGLLLFQYVSYWYWIVEHLRKSNDTKSVEVVTNNFQYELKDLEGRVVDACRAVAFHNVLPNVSGSDDILGKIKLDTEPILYLAMLCDELQRWDRFPVGDEYLRVNSTEDNNSIDGEDIELICSGTDTTTAIFRLTSSGVREKIRQALNDKRLPDWENIVSIE